VLWETFAESYDRLVVVCVYDKDELVMILPLTVKKDNGGASMFYLLGYDLSDYGDFIVKDGYEKAVRHVLTDVMKQNGVSQLHLRFTPPWSSLYQIIDDCYSENIAQEDNRVWQKKYVQVILPATWEEYLHSCNSKHRQDIRRALRKVENSGLVLDYDDQPSPSLISTLIDLHCESLARLGTESTFLDPNNRLFLERAYQRLFAVGKARLFTLKDQNTLAGFDIVLRDQAWFYPYLRGMNLDYLKLSPGVALLANIIRVAITENLYGVDLMYGSEKSYKDRWTNYTIGILGANALFQDIKCTSSIQRIIRSARGRVKRITRSARGRVRLRSRMKLVKDVYLGKLRSWM
jgi:CelD/BcsL family acetyltransferase involved in cellulose biosynthesis